MDISNISVDNAGEYYLQEYNIFIAANDWEQFNPYPVSILRKEHIFRCLQYRTAGDICVRTYNYHWWLYLNFLHDMAALSRFQQAMRLFYMGQPAPEHNRELARKYSDFKYDLYSIRQYQPDDITRESTVEGMRGFANFRKDYIKVIRSLVAHPEQQCEATRDFIDLAIYYEANGDLRILRKDLLSRDDVHIDNSDYMTAIKDTIMILRQ